MTPFNSTPSQQSFQLVKRCLAQRSTRLWLVLVSLLILALCLGRKLQVGHQQLMLAPTAIADYTTFTAAAGYQVAAAAAPVSKSSYVTTPLALKPDSSYVAICATAKDQNEDVCEWLQYHEQVVGIGKFYIMDHGSTNPMNITIRDCFDMGRVGYTYFERNATAVFKPQLWAYSECLRRHRHKHRWMAFIDLDEFIVLKQPGVRGIDQFMQQFEGFAGLVVHWLIFGSSGLKKRPKGGVLENYNATLPLKHPENTHIKSIVNTEYVAAPNKDPHHFKYNKGLSAVNSNLEPVPGPKSNHILHDKIVLFHYVLKSLDDYQRKVARGSAMGNYKPIQYFYLLDNQANSTCTYGSVLAKRVNPFKYKLHPGPEVVQFKQGA